MYLLFCLSSQFQYSARAIVSAAGPSCHYPSFSTVLGSHYYTFQSDRKGCTYMKLILFQPSRVAYLFNWRSFKPSAAFFKRCPPTARTCMLFQLDALISSPAVVENAKEKEKKLLMRVKESIERHRGQVSHSTRTFPRCLFPDTKMRAIMF